MQPLYLVAEIRPKFEVRDQVRAKLDALIAAALLEDGCVVYDLVVSEDDPDTWLMIEKWASRESWDAHMLTTHVVAFLAEGVSLFREPTELRLYNPA